MVLASHCKGGVAAAVGQCTDPSSDLEVLAAVTDRDDFTGNLEPRHGRRIGRWWVKPQPLKQISAINARVVHRYQYFIIGR